MLMGFRRPFAVSSRRRSVLLVIDLLPSFARHASMIDAIATGLKTIDTGFSDIGAR